MIGLQRREEHMRPVLWLLMGVAVGCGSLDRKDYEEQRAAAECRNYAQCSQGYYESEFRDMDDCVKELRNVLDDIDDIQSDNCDYDESEAAACVSRIRSLSCEDFSEGDVTSACDLIWDCR